MTTNQDKGSNKNISGEHSSTSHRKQCLKEQICEYIQQQQKKTKSPPKDWQILMQM